MPRDLALGNGRLLVTFDAAYTLRDFYFPHVGKENHTIGHPCRLGVWCSGSFAWLSDASWTRAVRYQPDSLVSDVHLHNPELGLQLHAQDAVHPKYALLLRSFHVTNRASELREVRLFFHQDFHISESEIGDTAYFEPVNRFLIHYKGRRYFLINGRTGGGDGIYQYATGLKEVPNFEGTWRDAEDGDLGMNPIAQGSVDSVVSFRIVVRPGETGRIEYWIAAGRDYWEVRGLNMLALGLNPEAPASGHSNGASVVPEMIAQTGAHWLQWIGCAPRPPADLPDTVWDLYRRSLLLVRSQIDHDGAIIAANDGDSMQFSRDTYSYMWPRDGAVVAHTLDRAGYSALSEQFFRFCARLMPRPSYYPDGYLLHKFHADGSVGSSWHPWVRNGCPSLPVQEDETALVLWAFWEHYQRRIQRDPSAQWLVHDLAPLLIVPAARFMLVYRDDREGRERFRADYRHEPTGLPLPSYDLWEERYGIHTFTVAATCAGLAACQRFLRLIAQERWADDLAWSRAAALECTPAAGRLAACQQIEELAQRCDQAARQMKAALQRYLWSPVRGSFARMLSIEPDGELRRDDTLDASTLFAMLAFGIFEPEEFGVRETIEAVEQRLWCKTSVGGIARYENDYYYRQSDDISNVPGCPWFICTLWGAMGRLFLARTANDLARTRDILHWVCTHAQPSGALAEQVHPYTGAALSVSPLTWSHATFVETVLEYCAKYQQLRKEEG